MRNKPNIIVFFTDQQRADSVSVYNDNLNITPNAERLAKKGVTFDNAYTCQPVCGPARSSLQSGLYPTKTGCFINGIALPENIPTIAKQLNATGYKTGYVGKWHLATTFGKFNHETTAIPENLRGGYKDYFTASDVLEFTSNGYGGYVFDKDNNRLDFEGYRPTCITDYALDFLSAQSADNPFLLFLSHIEPHHQNDAKHFQGPLGSKDKFKDCTPPADLFGEGNYNEEYADYLGAVESLDENLGRVMDKAEEMGLSEDTVIIFTSDHGCHFRTRNSEYKRSCHDSSVKIPLIISGGAFTGGKHADNLAGLIDLPKTILSLAGIDGQNLDGNNLIDVLNGKISEDAIFIQISEHHVGRAIRTKRYTYEVADMALDGYADSSSAHMKGLFLYDNEVDPSQTKNLIDDSAYADVKSELNELIKRKIFEVEGYLID